MKEVLLPELAESIVEGEILKWMVQEGDTIALEQPLCEVMTDKVTVELPSPYAGVLKKRLAQEGDIVAVHAAVALIDDGADAGESATVQNAADSASTSATQAIQNTAENPHTKDVNLPSAGKSDDSADLFKVIGGEETIKLQGLGPKGDQTPSAAALVGGRVLAVPAARLLARELGIDLTQVQGSGPNGRIRVQDVAGHVKKDAPAPASSPSTGNGLPVAPVQYKTPKGYENRETRVPLRGMRRMISNQMLASHLYTVRTLTVDEVNMTKLVELRGRIKAEAEAAGVKVSYLPFIFKAISTALRKFPTLNSSFDEATQEIILKDYVNIGMAVATEAGLMVPVIRDVPQKNILQLAAEIGDLGNRAKDGAAKPEEMSGSTFSVTNIGSIGALFTFPIINVPDAAIMGIHSIVKRPIVDANDNITIAHMMYLSLSFDHRLVDGAEAARFCKEVIRLLENPDRLLLEG